MKKFQRNVVSVSLLSILLVGLVFTLSGCGFLNQGPTAEFSISEETGDGTYYVDEELTFDASSSSSPDGDITSYEWDLNGDGNFTIDTTNATQTHSYSSAESYTVTLKVSGEGGTDSTSKDIQIEEEPDLNASFTMSPEPGEVDQAVSFDATGSTGDISTYEWDFGDGETAQGSDKDNIDHVYEQTGSYTVELTVKDGEGDLSIHGELLKVQTSSSTT